MYALGIIGSAAALLGASSLTYLSGLCQNAEGLDSTTALTSAMPGDDASALNPSAANKDIIDVAIEAGSFNTLAAALEAAGLVNALKGEGPFTVFAPTDEAFAKLPAGTVEELLKPENRDTLTAILTYHVVPGAVTAGQVTRLSHATTLNGQRVDIAVEGNTVRIDGATVTSADVRASNGIIHVIDSVILPNTNDLVDTAAAAGSFNTLLAAAEAAGLVSVLKGDDPLTVFAPTDEAFAQLPAGTVENLLRPENRDQLAAILTYHVVAGRVYARDAVVAERARTVQGGWIRAAIRDGRLTINGANVVASDIETTNGVIHVIDRVILPN